jgi:hypothetical protein
MRKRTMVLAGGTTVAAAALAAGVWLGLDPATAGTTGTCDAAYYELAAERDDGATEVDFELTGNTPGETWLVVVEHDGATVHESERVTDAEAGIDVELRRPAAEDTFTVTATPEGGLPCSATVPPA